VRTRSRVLVAVVVALLVHVGVHELVDSARMRVRAITPSSERVAIELALAHAPSDPSDRAEQPRIIERVKPRAVEPTSDVVDTTPDIVETVPAAPVVESAPPVDVAPMLPRVSPPSSFLERVIAGTSGVPPPRMDDLFRPPPVETDAQAAERKIHAFASAAAARGAPPGPDAGTTLELLEKLDDGTYRYETGGFVASIKVDGAVVFIDKDTGAGLGASGLNRDMYAPYGPAIDPIGRIDGTTTPFGALPSTTLGSGSFDPTAAMLRAQGQEPYEHEKLCFLDDTRDLRAELRIAHEKAQMAGLRRSLERAWFDDARTPAERRAAIFAIWDECREEEVGLLARELVESFVRQHLPKGSADAFTIDELAAFNATRTSTMEFAPYG
jgi:hypothetical protein